jgi:hypothetical protein
MKVLVTNNHFGTPLVWEYDQGSVERIDLIDFNIHELIQQTPKIYGHLPYDLFETIISYAMDSLLETRNFGYAFLLCTINRRSCFFFYNQIYDRQNVPTRIMLGQLGRTFNVGECFYEQFLSMPNPNNSGLNAVALTRLGSLRFSTVFDPWDFIPGLDIQKVIVDGDGVFEGIHMFPGQFQGDTIWIHGEEEDGVYDVDRLNHPVLLVILCDYTYSLIPTQRTVNANWHKFVKFLRRAYGPNLGVYIMVKHQIDAQNPFIETTEEFVQL